ncbi:O-antigen ligase family protein, partial [Paenibacillus sp. MCAF20]
SLLFMNAFLLLAFLLVLLLQKSLLINWLHIGVILYVACYWIACLYAVDLEAALLEASRVTSLIPLSLLVMNLSAQHLSKLYSSWNFLGLMLVVVGLLFHMERNGRLESLLYYANTLAIILLVNLLLSMFSFSKSQSKIHLFTMTITATGLLLTFSRSVWILWLLSIIAAIVFIPRMRALSTLLYVTASHAAGLLLAMAIKQDILFFLGRVSSIQASTPEFQIRLTYWKDSLSMFTHYFWGGSGGGGWAGLQHLYQSQPYFVKYIHNHFVQVALDIGIIGLIIWLTILIVFYKKAIVEVRTQKEGEGFYKKETLLIVSVMLLHAGFDFDLNFPVVFAMLICLIIPMSSRTPIILKMGAFKLSALSMVTALVIIFFIWMGTAYNWMNQGIRAAKNEQFVTAVSHLSKAEHSIPWSHSILYESAKVYIRKGNATKDRKYFESAKQQLELAIAKVPHQQLYTDLVEELNK